MQTLIVTNSQRLNSTLAKYLHYNKWEGGISAYTFYDLRVMSREILDTNIIVVEAYRLIDPTIDDYGLNMFLRLNKEGKKGLLLYYEAECEWVNDQPFAFRIPWRQESLFERLKKTMKNERPSISEGEIEELKKCFPYRTEKNHHHG